jgi:hypothetical protein
VVVTNVNEPNGQAACFPSNGAAQPAALAEFTLSRASADFYDVSIINGANIPISMGPNNLTAYQTTQHGINGYICGTGGTNVATSNGPGAATWAFVPPAGPTPPPEQYIAVLDGTGLPTGACTPGSCTTGVCGLAFVPSTNQFTQECGTFIGYWTGDQICGTRGGLGADAGFNCSDPVAGMTAYPNTTVTNLYQCNNGIPSCYAATGSTPNPNQCCGCANWWDTSVGALVPSAQVEACPTVTANSPWNSVIQTGGLTTPNLLAWLKTAVPSAYTYPFDDPSSTFTCPNCSTGGPAGQGCTVTDNAQFNTSNYTITFCPGGTEIPTPPG